MQPTANFGLDAEPWNDEPNGRVYAEISIPLGRQKMERVEDRARAKCEEAYRLQIQAQQMQLQREAIEIEIMRLRLEQMRRPTSTSDTNW